MADAVIADLRGTVIPVIRTDSAETAETLVDWLAAAGVSVFEITASVPGHEALVRELTGRAGLTVGAGTILDAAGAEAAIAAGARFIVSPAVVPEVAAAARGAGVPAILGAATPTEALAAHNAGAAAVKLFPIRQLGGPGFLRALRSVLPNIAFVPTGGIELDEVPEYFAAGAHAVGMGGQLAGDGDVAAGRRAAVTERAARLTTPTNTTE